MSEERTFPWWEPTGDEADTQPGCVICGGWIGPVELRPVDHLVIQSYPEVAIREVLADHAWRDAHPTRAVDDPKRAFCCPRCWDRREVPA